MNVPQTTASNTESHSVDTDSAEEFVSMIMDRVLERVVTLEPGQVLDLRMTMDRGTEDSIQTFYNFMKSPKYQLLLKQNHLQVSLGSEDETAEKPDTFRFEYLPPAANELN